MLAGHAVLHRMPAGSMLFEQAETPAFAQILVAGTVELLGVRGKDETRSNSSTRSICCCRQPC